MDLARNKLVTYYSYRGISKVSNKILFLAPDVPATNSAHASNKEMFKNVIWFENNITKLSVRARNKFVIRKHLYKFISFYCNRA